ncbi:MAG: protein phosphatase 2C domain-containing protein [Chloroherpetonaceae bacterium]|nr:protein phosphatase 2C domain-containing protein [Chloroherpetonaceae bacterium]
MTHFENSYFSFFSASFSDPNKSVNGDSINYVFIENENLFLCAVADGVSNSYSDTLSSSIAINTLFESFETLNDEKSLEKRLLKSAQQAHLSLYLNDKKPLYSTLTAVVWHTQLPFFFILNSGDSRVYQVNSEGIKQLTKDHSAITTKKDGKGGLIVREVLSQSLGSLSFKPSILPKVIEGSILLATDGFYKSSFAMSLCFDLTCGKLNNSDFKDQIHTAEYNDDASMILFLPKSLKPL